MFLIKNPLFYIATIGALCLLACEQAAPPVNKTRIRPVKTIELSRYPKEVMRRFAGGSQTAISSRLSFRIAGEVEQINVKAGQIISKGTLVARLNDEDARVRLKSDKAAHERALANEENSRAQYERMKNLFDRKLISQAEYDAALANIESSVSQTTQTESALKLSQKQVQYAQIKSPMDDCKVSQLLAEENENVAAGQLIATLDCGTSIEVIVAIPESVIQAVEIDQKVTVYFPSLKDRHFDGRVSEVGNVSSVNSAYPVTITIESSENILRSGMAAEVIFKLMPPGKANAFWVPLVAVGREGDSDFLFIYQPENDKQGIVKKRIIKTGTFTITEVEILSGVTEGERVITAGRSQIYDGLKVKLYGGR